MGEVPLEEERLLLDTPVPRKSYTSYWVLIGLLVIFLAIFLPLYLTDNLCYTGEPTLICSRSNFLQSGARTALGGVLDFIPDSRITKPFSSCAFPNPTSVPFGQETLRKLFFLDPSYTHINHGSYGGAPLQILAAEAGWQLQMETNLDMWFRNQLQPLLTQTRVELAGYLGDNVDPDDIVIIENASTGINEILVSTLGLNADDQILQLNIAYGAVKKSLLFISVRTGAEVVPLVIQFPTTANQIIAEVEQFFIDHPRTKIAVFDHISSTPAVILPIKELITLARSYGVLSIIDGAHALGQVPIDLPDLDPDYYYSNAHKWLLSAKGAAFLYVRKDLQNVTHPLVISASYSPSGNRFQEEFGWTGTKDYSPYISIIAAIRFRQQLTDAVAMGHNNQLCENAASMLNSTWKTDLPVPLSMSASLVNVRLPCNVNTTACYDWTIGDLVQLLVDKYKMYVVIFEIADVSSTARYVRISCQIYNQMSNYDKLASAIITETNPLLN